MTFRQMPPITLMHPAMRDPPLMRMGVLPMATYPLVTSTAPPPVATEPDIASRRRRSIFLEPGWGRGHLDHGTYVISM